MSSLFDGRYNNSPCVTCPYNYGGDGCELDCMLDDFRKTSDCIEGEVEEE